MATQSIAEHEIAALARPILEDRFRNQIEILSVRTGQHQGRLTMDVSYRGDPAALHPQRFKGISRRIRPQLQAMGMRDQLIERYTQTTDEEWNARAQAPHGQTTDGEWSELVQATTEIDTSLPIDRAEFERLAEEWLEQRPQRRGRRPDDQTPRLPEHHRHRRRGRPVTAGKAGPKPRSLVLRPQPDHRRATGTTRTPGQHQRNGRRMDRLGQAEPAIGKEGVRQPAGMPASRLAAITVPCGSRDAPALHRSKCC